MTASQTRRSNIEGNLQGEIKSSVINLKFFFVRKCPVEKHPDKNYPTKKSPIRKDPKLKNIPSKNVPCWEMLQI